MTVALDVRAVAKEFAGRGGGTAALGPVDLRLDDGEIVALIGPSGCGKTTLLRLVAGLIRPSAGAISLNGEGLAMVFQDANLLPWLSVERNVALPLKVRGVPRAERLAAARELCRLVGIAGFERHWPAQLSVGMRQRAALARSLVAEPSVLLMDEPFAALDAITRDEMNVELQRIWGARPTTVLLVTHALNEAVMLADRVVVFSARPARVVAEVAVPLPRPRGLEMQHEHDFQELVRRVHLHLLEGT